MKLRIFVQPATREPGAESNFQDFTDATETVVPDVGDTIQLSSMKSPQIVKTRHFKYLDPDTLELRLYV